MWTDKTDSMFEPQEVRYMQFVRRLHKMDTEEVYMYQVASVADTE